MCEVEVLDEDDDDDDVDSGSSSVSAAGGGGGGGGEETHRSVGGGGGGGGGKPFTKRRQRHHPHVTQTRVTCEQRPFLLRSYHQRLRLVPTARRPLAQAGNLTGPRLYLTGPL